MSKINPYDLPAEEERNIRIVLKNIRWDTNTSSGYHDYTITAIENQCHYRNTPLRQN